jgi:hypothetical protein
VRLVMEQLALEDGGSIDPVHIRVINIDGLPEGLEQGFLGSASLDAPVTLFASGAVAPAVETTIHVALRLDLPAGTVPGSFSGNISIEVIPII